MLPFAGRQQGGRGGAGRGTRRGRGTGRGPPQDPHHQGGMRANMGTGRDGFKGNARAAAERLRGTVKAVGGRLRAVGNAVGAGPGGWEVLWGRVRAGLGGGYNPPPPLQANCWGHV